jgi:RNA polymerase sigma-70 factor, ECF subfamily
VILRDRQEAEDAVQEAFTKAYVALERFRPGASFRAWLLRIVVNEAHDLLSARHRRADLLSGTAARPAAAPAVESAEAAALNQGRREALLAALFDLPETDRLVLTCRYFLDLSEAETADVLGVARGTVKSRLSRAIARLGPIVRDLGPLVLVPPILDLSHAVMQHIGGAQLVGGGGKGAVATLWSKIRSNAQQIATLGGSAAVALALASVVMIGRGRSAPAPSPPRSVFVYGGDLNEAERQQVLAAFGPGVNPQSSDTVSRQELVDTLDAQGISVQSTDAALSSVELRCGANQSGLQIRTINIERLTPTDYALALITSGIYDASATVAAPADKGVSGETALVGMFKAYPTCSGGSAADPARVGLAYQEFRVLSELEAGTDVFIDVFNAVVSGQAPDDASVRRVLAASASTHNVTVAQSTANETASLFAELRALNFGPYSRGVVVQPQGQETVRVVPAQ